MSWFQLPSFLRSSRHSSRPATQRKPGRPPFQKTLLFEAMEPRILLSGDPTTTLGAAATVTFTGATDDVVGIHLVSNASDNGGVVIDLTYIDDASVLTKVTLGNAVVGVTSLEVFGGAGDDRFTADALGAGVLLTIHGDAGTDTLIGPDAATAWTINAANAGFATGVTGFDSIENLTGRSGVDTFNLQTAGSISGTIDGGNGDDQLVGPDTVVPLPIVPPNTANIWSVTGTDAGSVNAGAASGFANFVAMEKISGGSAADVFTLTSADSISVEIAGGGGIDTLIGFDADNKWVVSGAGAGSLNAIVDSARAFVGMENLTGGSDDDEFKIGASGALTGVIDGGAFDIETPTVNTLDYSTRGAPVTVNLQTGAASGLTLPFSRITKVVGSNAPAPDTLIGPLPSFDQTAWSITGANSGSVDDTEFVGFENLTGQDATNDAFLVFAGGSVSGTVSGGSSGLDGLAVVSAGGLSVLQPLADDAADPAGFSGIAYAGMDRFDPLSGDDTHRVITGTLFDRNMVVVADGAGLAVSFEGVTFSSGPSTFTFAIPSASLTLATGTGVDEIVATLPAAFTGALLTYDDGVLTGTLTAGNDTAVVTKTGLADDDGLLIDLTVNGATHSFGTAGVGVKSVVLHGLGGNDSFSLDEVLLIDAVTIDGGLDTDTLVGANLGMQWDITGPDSGTFSGSADGAATFVNVENLSGRAGADRFNLRSDLTGTGSISGVIDGGLGTDTLIGADVNNAWRLTGVNAGLLDATIDTDYTRIENLIGGSAADLFQVIGASASLTGLLDGGLTKAIDPDAADPVAAIDTLDFSARGAAVSVNLALATAGGIAAFSRIDSIVGSSLAGDTLTGPDVGEVLDPATAAPAVLSPGTRVLVTDGTGSEAIYEYIGEELTDGNPSITGDQPFNLAIQDYSDPALWKLVDDHVNWNITGANAGEVEGTAFSSFENLTGRGASSDYFLFGAAGSLSGTLAGGVQAGSDTADGFAVFNATTNTTDVFQATTPEQSGTIVLAGKTIVYTGMDPAEFIEGDNAERQINGSVFDDDFILEDADTATQGQMRVTFDGWRFTSDGVTYTSSLVFDTPTTSLTIEGGSGADTITVNSLDAGFAADLLLYGNKAGAPTIEPDAGHDIVTFADDVFTGGGYLEVFADEIKVRAGVTLSTRIDGDDLTTANDIVFRARRIGTTEIENLLPSGYLSKSVDIDIGANAVLEGSNVYLIAQAEDRALADVLGLTTLQSQFFLDPALTFLQDLVSLPVKVLVKASSANVSIHSGAQILADNVIGVYATAGSDASAQAKSQLFSIGYSQADATATITIESDVLIEGGGAVNVTSSAEAVAAMTTETSREEQGSVPGKKSNGFAASIAVSWARLTSTVTVAEDAYVHGGRTVNIRALGDVESEAESESSLYADGSAALSLALQFSTANVLSQVAGKVQADMNTPGGEVVKFEFDSTLPAAVFKSTDTASRLQTGDTVQLAADIGTTSFKKGTILEYVGPDIATAVNLATQTYVDNPTVWKITSEPRGFVDTVNDRIAVFEIGNDVTNWVVVTEDTADYSPRRGDSIGGLDAGQTYVIVTLEDDARTAVDESRYVKLARTEQQAIDAYVWEAAGTHTGRNPYVVDLTSAGTTNDRKFNSGNVAGDTITLNGVGNTFELGQAVNYYEPGHDDDDHLVEGSDGNLYWRDPNGKGADGVLRTGAAVIDGTLYTPRIEGLEHGGLYYVMAGVDQFNLIGDQRLVDKQVLQLGALENETRGGIARVDLGAVTPGMSGFELRATQILDSTFLTFGIGTLINASDTASATAGFAAEDVSDKKKDDDGGFHYGDTAFDKIFDKLNEAASATQTTGSEKASLQLAGAFAFSYTDHDAKTLIKSTADLNSNDDMELT
ncbi:MAG: LEPR-XLL domain-containing protein, partial [Pseudomonadota bacterium]